MILGGQQLHILLGLAAQGQSTHDAQAEDHGAEDVDGGLRSNSQIGSHTGQIDAHGLIQGRIQEEGDEAHGDRSGVQVEALVDLRRMAQTGGDQEADEHAHDQGHDQAGQVEANHFGVGITHQQIGQQGGDAGGEDHGVDIHLLLLHQAVQHNTQHGGQDVDHIHAPGGEAHGEDECEGGDIVAGCLEDNIQSQQDNAHQTHVQEGGRIAAQVKIVGGDLGGTAQNGPKAGDHLGPVGHEESTNDEAGRHKGHKQLQEAGFGHGFQFIHGKSPDLYSPQGRAVALPLID